jgi:hypothetical protein
MDPQLIARIEMLEAAYKASPTTPLVTPPHGPLGLFNTPGLERGIVNAMVQPLPGLLGELYRRGHVRTGVYTNPIFGILTGQTASSGTEPTAGCTPGRTPGNFKLCQQAWPFGQMTMSSQVIRLQDAGQYVNRGESVDLQLIGNPFAEVAKPLPVSPEQMFKSKWAKAVLELVNAINRDYCGLVFTGNPANTPNSSGYIEYNGLDRIIQTGYADVITHTACPAADSLIVNNLAGVNVATDAETTVATIVETYDLLNYTAERMFLGPVEWAFVMKRGLFRALTQLWPCTYRTYRCHTPGSTNTQVVLDGSAMAQDVVDMRNGQYLLIDGKKIPVLLDDCLSETFINNVTAGGGLNESDFYLIPMSSPAFSDTNGQITYIENFDYRAPGAAQSIINDAKIQSYGQVSNDGRYLILNESPTYGCFVTSLWTRPRLIVRAPFLAAKFNDARYQKRYNERSPFPGNAYNLDGGNYSFTGQTTYSSPS